MATWTIDHSSSHTAHVTIKNQSDQSPSFRVCVGWPGCSACSALDEVPPGQTGTFDCEFPKQILAEHIGVHDLNLYVEAEVDGGFVTCINWEKIGTLEIV